MSRVVSTPIMRSPFEEARRAAIAELEYAYIAALLGRHPNDADAASSESGLSSSEIESMIDRALQRARRVAIE